MFRNTSTPVFEAEVVEFYPNLGFVTGDVATSRVCGIDILFDKGKHGEILHIPIVGLAEYTWLEDSRCLLTLKFTERRVTDVSRKVFKAEMPPFLKLLFEVMHKVILPRGERRHEVIFFYMGIAHTIDLQELIDWPTLIMLHMARIVDPTEGPHQLAYGNLLTYVFRAFKIPLSAGRALTKKDMIDRHTALECQVAAPAVVAAAPIPPRTTGAITQLIQELCEA